jgi:hypothetical protein
VAVVDFANAGWLAGEAAWYLDWDRSDFERPALGALRLLLNQQHKVVVDAVTARNPNEGQRAVLETIRYDVAKTLTTAALRSVDFLEGVDTFADGSVGRELARLLKSVLPEESPRTAAAILEEDPSRFDCELQASLKLLWNSSGARA